MTAKPASSGDPTWATGVARSAWRKLSPGVRVTQHGERLPPSPRASEAAHEWVVNVGAPLAHQPPPPRFSLPPFFPSSTHSAEPLVGGGARFVTPTPTCDGVSRSRQLRALPGRLRHRELRQGRHAAAMEVHEDGRSAGS
jgi:hypothetical protein